MQIIHNIIELLFKKYIILTLKGHKFIVTPTPEMKHRLSHNVVHRLKNDGLWFTQEVAPWIKKTLHLCFFLCHSRLFLPSPPSIIFFFPLLEWPLIMKREDIHYKVQVFIVVNLLNWIVTKIHYWKRSKWININV